MSIYLFNVSIIHFFSFINIVNSIQNILVEKNTIFTTEYKIFHFISLIVFTYIYCVGKQLTQNVQRQLYTKEVLGYLLVLTVAS